MLTYILRQTFYNEVHENWPNIEETVLPSNISPYILPQPKSVLDINIFRRTFVPNFIISELATQDLYPFCLPYHAVTMATYFRQLSKKKMLPAHLHPMAHISAKFHGNPSKTEAEVRDARFATDRPTVC